MSKTTTQQLILSIKNWALSLFAGKQDTLTFDTTPTANSTNPVTSDGIHNAISNFVTITVDNLLNYYLKSETYTKAEVQQLIASISGGISFVVANSLPTASADTMNKIYLIPASSAETGNVKDEYLTIRSGAGSVADPYTYTWELIGSTAVDLSGYYTKGQTDAKIQADLNAALASYYTKNNVDTLLGAKANKSEMSFTDGTGANADKTTIQLKSGTTKQVLISHQDISGKEDKSNKTTTINGDSTDTQYSSAKAVYTAIVSAINSATTSIISTIKSWAENLFLQKGTYDASTAVGLADNIRGDVYADEQFAVRMTGGEANEVGGIGVVQQLKGAGAAIVQLFPEGANHDFSGDVSLDGTGGNAEAPLRYSNNAGTVEMGYLLCLEAFVSQTLTQAQLDAISAKDSGKADRDKAVWLTPAGAITSAPTIESGQTEVTFSGWRIAMRVKASEVRDASASSYWFTAGTAGRQVFDVAVAEGIDGTSNFSLANGWNTGSAMEYLNHMAAQGLPTHSVKAMSALLSVTKIGIKTVKSRNLLNPQTGRALLKAYVNDDESFEDNEYTMLGGLPSGSTMAFTSLLTGKTETLTMLDATHFVIPSDGWLQITGTLPESIIATWDGTKDNTAADEYATESHVWDVTQLFGTKDGGTEGHYYRFAPQGMRGAGSAQDVVELVGARGEVKMKSVDLGTLNNWSYYTSNDYNFFLNANFPYISTAMRISSYARGGLNTALSTMKECPDKTVYFRGGNLICLKDKSHNASDISSGMASFLNGVYMFCEQSPLTFTSLFLSASSTADELTQMPADAIPLSEIQFADNNWSIEEAIYDAPEADANGVITPTAVTGQMRIQYSLDAAEQIDTLQKEYQALEARVAALENA